MDDLYRQLIIDRYKNPLYRGSLNPHDIAFEDDNPLCGDHIRVELRVDGGGVVKEAALRARLRDIAGFRRSSDGGGGRKVPR